MQAGLKKQNRESIAQAKQYKQSKKNEEIRIGDLIRVKVGQNMDPQTKKLARLWKGSFTVIKRCVSVFFSDIENSRTQFT